MKYNALENIELAKRFREQLILEQQDIGSSISYDAATSWCDDCPRGGGHGGDDLPVTDEFGFGIRYASTCCKEDGGFEEQYTGSFKKMEDIGKLLQALSTYLDEVTEKP